MGDIVQFVPRKELDSIGNLQAFIKLCREELTAFGKELDWEADLWDLTDFIIVRGRNGRIAIAFSSYDTKGSKKIGTLMSLAFQDFSKAYMRYQHSLKPTCDVNKRMAALRALEKILIERSSDGVPRIEKTDPEILNTVASMINRDAPATAYGVGGQLALISKFLVEHRLTIAPFVWKNPNRRPNDTNIRVGPESEKRRSEKLPSAEAIDALIEAYRMATEPRDVIITSIAGILVCAPDRINEVFRLPVLCEHTAKYEGEEAYGLRWWPSKGAEPMIKWVTKTMAEIAQEAVKRLKEHTEEARKMARWYEANPRRLYLTKEYEHLRSQEFVTGLEISEIIGLANGFVGYSWAHTHGLQPTVRERLPGQIGKLPYSYRFEEVEDTIIAMLPKDFPIFDPESKLKYSEALILLPKNTFQDKKATYRCMFEILTTDTFNNGLGAGEKHGKDSVFSRLGIKNAEGSSFKITSHQFRHWLNTIAQNAGLSQLHIAKWSGRKDISQNADYDHVTGSELIARARELSGGRLFGPIADFVMHAPMTKEEFLKLAFPTAHVTEYGYCIHDWTMTPCNKYRDCLLCTDHLCVKGNMRTEALREKLQITEQLYQRAKIAADAGDFGADRWTEHHLRILEVLRGHKDILDDPEIPTDSVYQLSGIREYSPVSMAIEDRMTHDDPDAAALKLVMDRLSSLGYDLTSSVALPCAGD
jgi:hypothetical protein